MQQHPQQHQYAGENSTQEWKQLPQFCAKYPTNLTCTPSGYSWLDPACRPFLDGPAACSALLSCGYRRMAFVGDSYLRHAMIAMVLTLTQDYRFGSMDPEGKVEKCAFGGQFEEKMCRHHVVRNVQACGGSVTVDLNEESWETITPRHASYDAVFFGAGRHPTKDGRVYDASSVVQEKIKPLCEQPGALDWISGVDIKRPRVYWFLSHARAYHLHPDEAAGFVYQYNKGMAPAMGQICKVPSMDFYTMTNKLVYQLPEEAKAMTHDGQHWSIGINLIEAQMMLWNLLDACHYQSS